MKKLIFILSICSLTAAAQFQSHQRNIQPKMYIGGTFIVKPATEAVTVTDSLTITEIDDHKSVKVHINEYQKDFILWNDTTTPTYKQIGAWSDADVITRLKEFLPQQNKSLKLKNK